MLILHVRWDGLPSGDPRALTGAAEQAPYDGQVHGLGYVEEEERRELTRRNGRHVSR